MVIRTNYLNNKDILKEIHKSKAAYCWFLSPELIDYDIIVGSVDDIVPNIEEGRRLRAKRLTVAEQDAGLLADGVKMKADETSVEIDDIKDQDIIFRVMTWEHIPEAPPPVPKVAKTKKTKVISELFEEDAATKTEYDEEEPVAPTKYAKVNFPPFLQYRLTADNQLELIGKSHWKGDLETGSFDKDYGQITRKLSLIYMKLCERYATRWNWRGYSYNDEMVSQALLQLSQIGLQFDESKSANPFAYYTVVVMNSFRRVLNTEKRNQNIRDDILEMNSLNPSFTRQNSGSDHSSDDY